MPEHTSYWLLVKGGQCGKEFLETRLSEGQRALPIFSFAEEAEMFLCLRGSRDGWQVEKVSAADLLSMLYTTFKGTGYVTLDPIPESSCLNTTGILSISLKDFAERLNKATTRNGLPEKMTMRLPALERSFR